MKKILVDQSIEPAALAALKQRDDVTVQIIGEAQETREVPTEVLSDAQILFCTFPPINIAEAKRLEFVQISSVGFTQAVGLGFPERGVTVCNARGVFDPTIAEWNIAMMINLLRDLRSMIRNQENGVWYSCAQFQSELRGLTVGIWGYGGIGRATARLAKAMGMRVKVLSRSGAGPRDGIYLVENTGDPQGELPDEVFDDNQREEFLGDLDFLILSLPLSSKTEGMIGELELQSLPRSAFLLNPARGPLVKEEALLRALREEWIAGAALDTHYYYPMPANHPLWKFPNVIMTPHISGSSESPQYLKRVWDLFFQNVERQSEGKVLLNQIDPKEL